MRRVRPLDLVLLIIVTPLWFGCLALHGNEVMQGRLAWVPVFVTTPTDSTGYPIVREFWPGVDAHPMGLEPGDQLLHVGAANLQGAGPWEFVAHVYEQAGSTRNVPVRFLRGSASGEATLSLIPVRYPWRTFPLVLGLFVTGVFALLHERGSPQARAYFLASLTYSLHWAFFFGGSRLQTFLWSIVFFTASSTMFPLALRAATIFPERLLLTGARTPIWFWLFALFGPLSISWIFAAPFPPGLALQAVFLINSIFVVALLIILTRNYRRATPFGRRQLRWIVYGFYMSMAPILAVNIFTLFNPRFWWVVEVASITAVILPICIYLALVHGNFLDIDRLISSTAAYSLLLVALAGVIFVVAPQLAQAASLVANIDPASWQTTFSLMFALLLLPGERRLRPPIERFFFPARYAIEQGVKQLSQDILACVDPHALFVLVTERLEQSLQPESFVLYACASEASAAVMARGGAVPSALKAEHPLMSALPDRRTPLEVERWRNTAKAYLNPEDLETLDRLRAAVILPFPKGKRLVAFLCLGQKRSGDVYTSTDLALLTLVIEKTANQFIRYTEEEIAQGIAALITPQARD